MRKATESSVNPFQQFKYGRLRSVSHSPSLSTLLISAVQDALPEGATRVGIILASDATLLTTGTGDLSAHPLLMTIDNIDSGVRRKSSCHAWVCIALLPKAKVTRSHYLTSRAVKDQIFHWCIRDVLEPLRKIAEHGKFMPDPLGQMRKCYTVLSMYTVDYPEATTLAGVIDFTSPVTVAGYHDLGNIKPCDRRWFADTRANIDAIRSEHDPATSLESFAKACFKERYTGVVEYLWDGWKHCEPSFALGFDILHSGLKFWHRHIFGWIQAAVMEREINFRFKALHPRRGFRYFRKGVTNIAKTGGRDHRDMMAFMLCALDGAAPPQLMSLVRCNLDYFYLAQKNEVSVTDILTIHSLLRKFHKEKDHAHVHKWRTTAGWSIPKLELQHQITVSIRALGALQGFSTDISEHELIQQIKIPFEQTNHKDYDDQMVTILIRGEQLRHFDLATALASSPDAATKLDPRLFADELDENGQSQWLNELSTIQKLRSAKRADSINYFSVVEALQGPNELRRAQRVRTFIATPFTAVHHNRDPSIREISIEEASNRFNIPDLGDALKDYYYRLAHQEQFDSNNPILTRSLGNRSSSVELPFTYIRVWFTIRVQTKSLLEPGTVANALTLSAEPPSFSTDPEQRCSNLAKLRWDRGRHDCALFINDMGKPFSGKASLKGQLSLDSLMYMLTAAHIRSLRGAAPSDISTAFLARPPHVPHICSEV